MLFFSVIGAIQMRYDDDEGPILPSLMTVVIVIRRCSNFDFVDDDDDNDDDDDDRTSQCSL